MSQANAQQNTLSFQQFSRLFFEAYTAGDIARALALLSEHDGLIPDHASTLANWQMCLLAISGRIDEALDAFRAALDKGYWWSVEQLRDDPDLASLQGLPAFEEGVSICAQRFEAVRHEGKPERIDLLPEVPAGHPRPLIVSLHGRGGNTSDNQELWQAAARCGWQVALLGSSQVNGYNSRCWDDRALALREVRQHLDELCATYPIDQNRLVLAGFSQSGWLTAMWTLKGALPIRRFLLICPANRHPQEIHLLNQKNIPAGLRGVILAGESDIPWVTTAHRLDDYLTRREVPHQAHFYPNLGHELPPDFSDKLPAWLDYLSN